MEEPKSKNFKSLILIIFDGIFCACEAFRYGCDIP